MPIIGCDFHPDFQQIACVGTETGELSEQLLARREEAETFHRVLRQRLGKSGRAMLEVTIGGDESAERLADLALGHLRSQIPHSRQL